MGNKKDFRSLTVGNHELSPETQMMGYGFDPKLSEGALKPPVFLTSTFVFESAEHGKDFFDLVGGRRELNPGESAGLVYSRFNNPDMEVLEDRLALWEKSELATVFSSGMAAIFTAIMAHMKPGEVLVYSQPIYGGTETLILNLMPKWGIKTVGFAANDSKAAIDEAFKKAQEMGPVGMALVETPANPTCGLVDIRYVRNWLEDCQDSDGERPPLAVDNTFLGPVWQKPLEHGADIVLYSLTKYVGGHSDLVAGAAAGPARWVKPMKQMRSAIGNHIDPHTCWMVMRSLETLKIRFERATENARTIAEFLRDHPKVDKVHYLGFLDTGSPAHAVFTRQCLAPGSTFAFDLKGGEPEAFRFLNALEVVKLAVSLGGTETLICHPASTTHSGVPRDLRAKAGVNDALCRISVGIESAEDLIADLTQALDKV
ncbi:methionine gamma-lyase [Rhodothalassium salexigens]|uniref:cystathionine gamma-synthase family protein n=1 Tax=Rhodothalassium salexigens TaxID=1086 RepID=UPI001914A719|nr:cystathionine gamma-synthase family protein [Rhodothalassium salexigens]MBK5911222.1 methionine gamma-lyase [Rhodothalassium salexigens]